MNSKANKEVIGMWWGMIATMRVQDAILNELINTQGLRTDVKRKFVIRQTSLRTMLKFMIGSIKESGERKMYSAASPLMGLAMDILLQLPTIPTDKVDDFEQMFNDIITKIKSQ